MDITHDLREPTIVIVGIWNAAILSDPAWLAYHIYDFAENEEIDVSIIGVEETGSIAKQIVLFPNGGLACLRNRVEIYHTLSSDDESLYRIVRNLANKLPHTPVSGIGVNFQFHVAGDLGELISSLETSEGLSSFGEIQAMERRDALRIDNPDALSLIDGAGTTLTMLRRTSDFVTLDISLNFDVRVRHTNSFLLWTDMQPLRHWTRFVTRKLMDAYSIGEGSQLYLEGVR